MPYQYLLKTYDVDNILAQHWACRIATNNALVWHSDIYIWKKQYTCMALSTEIHMTATEIKLLWHPTLISTYCEIYI
jgi:hypothetical protein